MKSTIAFLFLLSLAGGVGKAWGVNNYIAVFTLTSTAHFLTYLSMLISGWTGNKVYENLIKKSNNKRSAAFIGISLGIIILLILTAGLHIIPGIGEEVSAFYNRPSKQ